MQMLYRMISRHCNGMPQVNIHCWRFADLLASASEAMACAKPILVSIFTTKG